MNKTESKFKETEIGEIPEEWNILRINEVGKVITGKTPPTKVKEYFGSDFPFIKIPDMGKSVYIENSVTMLSKKGAEYMGKLKLPKDSVMVSCLATIGKVGITKRESFTNQQINSLICDTKKVYPLWAYYFFKNNVLYLENLGGGGSVYTNISKGKFENAIIPTPTIEEQKEIIKILFDLDAKVELNQEMNKTLEAVGKAIFKRWFIDFEFPNEKGESYKSSGGEMVDSELGEIPKGWQVGKLREFIFVERGLSYKGSGLSEEGIPMINLGNIAPNNHFRYEGLKYYSGEYKERNLVKPGDLVIANTDITQNREVLGSCLVVPDDLGSDKVIFTHHIYAVRHKNSKLSNHFISFLLQIPEYRERASGFATGTTVLALPEDAILDFNFVLPAENLMKKYDAMLTYIKNKAAENIKESKNLSTIRDSLLPKLMSGKIRVPVEVK